MNIKQRNSVSMSRGIDMAISLAKKRVPVLLVKENGLGGTAMATQKLREATNKEPVIFNVSLKDDSDFGLLNFNMENRTSEIFPNSELIKIAKDGTTHPVMMDECAKFTTKAVGKNTLAFIFDRMVGGKKIPDDCLIIAITNLASEGLGDFLDPHERNRLVIIKVHKDPVETHLENYGYSKYEPEISAWALQNTQMGTESFEDYDNMEELKDDLKKRKVHNSLGIFDPKIPSGEQYLNYRSLDHADDCLKLAKEEDWSNSELGVAMMGAMGERATNSFMTLYKLAGKIQSPLDVDADPENCKLPADGAASSLMLHKLRDMTQVFNSEGVLNPDATRKRVGNYLTYIKRMKREYQAQFVRGSMKDSRVNKIYEKNDDFQDLAVEFDFLNRADK